MKPNTPTIFFTSMLRPHNGHWGEWSNYVPTSCHDSFFIGVDVEILGDLGGNGKAHGDDRGATNLKMKCGDGKWVEGTNNEKKSKR